MAVPLVKSVTAEAPAPYKISGQGSDWHDIVAALQLNGLARELAQHCELRELGEGNASCAWRRHMGICR